MSKRNDLEARTRDVQDGLDAHTLKLLKVLGHRRVGEIAAKIGRSRNHYSRSLVHKEYRFSNEDRIKTLLALGREPEDFYSGFFDFDLDLYLAELELREPGEVRKVEERLRRAKPASGSLDALRRLVAGLEELRIYNSEAAQHQSYRVLSALWQHGDSKARSTVKCEALGILTATHRREERFSAAAWCLRTGLKRATNSRLLDAKALLLQRACYLLADQAQFQHALGVSDEALNLYIQQRDWPGAGRILVVSVILLRRLGKTRRAIGDYRSSLQFLPEDDWIHRVAAHQGMGLSYAKLKQIKHADECLKSARRIVGSESSRASSIVSISLHWLRGEILLASRNLEAAQREYEAVKALYLETGNVLGLVDVSARLSKVLLLSGKEAQLRDLARQMTSLLTRLRRRDKSLAAAFGEFLRAAGRGEVTTPMIERLNKF